MAWRNGWTRLWSHKEISGSIFMTRFQNQKVLDEKVRQRYNNDSYGEGWEVIPAMAGAQSR